MREIKFRAWDKKSERMFYSQDASGFDENTGREYFPFVFEIGYKGSRDIDLMQYPGLKDKNGKEIYEGDILKKYEPDYNSEEYQNWVDSEYEGDEPTKEIFDVCEINFRYWLKNESFGYEGEDLENPDEWEVVGNIYQTPELLKP